MIDIVFGVLVLVHILCQHWRAVSKINKTSNLYNIHWDQMWFYQITMGGFIFYGAIVATIIDPIHVAAAALYYIDGLVLIISCLHVERVAKQKRFEILLSTGGHIGLKLGSLYLLGFISFYFILGTMLYI